MEKGISVAQIAARAGLLEHYYAIYTSLSLSVHSTLRDLDHHLSLDHDLQAGRKLTERELLSAERVVGNVRIQVA